MDINKWIDFVYNFTQTFETKHWSAAKELISNDVIAELTSDQGDWLQMVVSTIDEASVACASDRYDVITAYRQALLSPQ